VIHLPKSADYLENIRNLRDYLIHKDLTAYKKVAFNLYQDVLAPVVEGLNDQQLIIVPHKELWYINFDLLLTESSKSNNAKELPYLLRTFDISYANSASLLMSDFQTGGKDVLQECLAFSYADTADLKSGNLMSFKQLRDLGDDLPGSRVEIQNISKIIDGQFYFGKEADERNFKANAANYSILHLAVHGETDDENPGNSNFSFVNTHDSIEDNRLFAHEIYNLNIPAKLAVLSACNTGGGEIASGEGIMRLGQAFQYAGTESIVLSGWEVSDGVAPEIMKNFYTHMKAGMSKSSALKKAKLEFLENTSAERSNPYYWGNFFILGSNKPVDVNSGIPLNMILYAGVATLELLVFYLVYKSRSLNKVD